MDETIAPQIKENDDRVLKEYPHLPMTEHLSFRAIEKEDLKKICTLPQSSEELFFMFPKAEYPLTCSQLETTVQNRFASTVFLYDEEIAGFANFYEVEENQYCSIGNVIVGSRFRNQGIGEFIIKTMEQTGVEKYNASTFRMSCFNTNTQALLLYSKLGYKPYGIEKRINSENKSFALIKLKKDMNGTGF